MQVLAMLQKSSPGKAAGIDNISAQLLRISCEHTLRQLFYPGETSEFAHRNFIFWNRSPNYLKTPFSGIRRPKVNVNVPIRVHGT